MTTDTRVTGQQGEAIAQSVLRRQGFQIEAVNWRWGRYGEIDLIAFHPSHRLLVFTEVKTRRSTGFGAPIEAVNTRKQEKLLLLAEAYLKQHPQPADVQVRFDVIGIYYPGHGRPAEILHIEDAFAASGE